MTTEPVNVLASEMRMMDSKHTGRKYRITIHLPLSYAAPPGEDWPFNDVMAKWPTLYVPDGNWYSSMVAGIVRPMRWCGSTSDAIVVGIGYPEDEDAMESLRETFVRRNADLTPVPDEAEEKSSAAQFKRPAPHGDSGNFLKFLQNELVPMIERDFRSDPANRIWVGHSYGGLFGLFAMFEAPELFQKLIIGSPTMAYGKRWMFQREEAYAKAHKALAATVYLYAAELEEGINDSTLSDTIRLGAILNERHYEGLRLIRHIFEDQNHCEVAAPGFQWGLKQALKR